MARSRATRLWQLREGTECLLEISHGFAIADRAMAFSLAACSTGQGLGPDPRRA